LPRVFSRGAISVDAVMASACLPQLFPAVEIEGEAYWDGGFTGNPSLYPLIEGMRETDLMLVQINPVERGAVPRGARDIINRMNEITFNASLVKELAALCTAFDLWPDVETSTGACPAIRLHRIDSGAAAQDHSASGKLDAGARQIARLFELGRTRAEAWFAAHPDALGRTSTLELDAFGSRGQLPYPPRQDAGLTQGARRAPAPPFPWGGPLSWARGRRQRRWSAGRG
jgi:NTE family protein